VNGDTGLTLESFYGLDTAAFELTMPHQTRKRFMSELLKKQLKEGIVLTEASDYFSLKVSSPDPMLSTEINRFLLNQLEIFGEQVRYESANHQRKFIQDQLRCFMADLSKSEAELLSFRQSNHFLNSPNLQMQEQRLLREVNINTEIVLEFRKQLELSRVEENRRSANLEIIQQPQEPLTKYKPKRRQIALIGFVFGLMLGVFLTLTIESLHKNRS
ncbi:MAG TPA: GNVR domain-containing protein, partial [Fibrobacteraceae bacterium]|nr:GNVR domain-containing protein [Fibrobacteraceae bacterium]